MLRGQCHWCWTCVLRTSAGEVALTLVLVARYITPLNEAATDNVLQYRADYNNCPSHAIAFMTDIPSTSGRLHCEFVLLLFLQTHRENDRFLAA